MTRYIVTAERYPDGTREEIYRSPRATLGQARAWVRRECLSTVDQGWAWFGDAPVLYGHVRVEQEPAA